MLRIAFAGTPDFAVPALRALAASAHRLVGVLTQPDRPSGRGRAPKPSPVKHVALELAVPLAQPERLASESEREPLRGWDTDLLVVVAYGLLLPRAVLTLPRHGCINIHASLLPRWRGAAPVQRAILAGDQEIGVTLMQLDEGLDTGPMLAQRRHVIGPQASAAQVLDQLAGLGSTLLLETLGAIESGTVRAMPQPSEGVSYAPKIEKREARIDWHRSAEHIARQVRAFNPWPIAETHCRDEPLRVWEAHVAKETPTAAAVETPTAAAGRATDTGLQSLPGRVLAASGHTLQVRCGEGVLAITRLQRAGRRALSAAEFIAGQPLIGAQFT